jgi:hypothetical protein
VERSERAAARARIAAPDLATCAAWAAGEGMHLVIDGRVGEFFPFTREQLPGGTVDARDGDSLAVVLEDPAGLLVTLGGLWLGTPVKRDRRWAGFERRERTWAVLVVSALSGAYYGLHVSGTHRERFVSGVRERLLRVEAIVELSDGSVVDIERTTIDYRVTFKGSTQHARTLEGALKVLEQPVTRVESNVHDEEVLATAVERAGVLPDRMVVLNRTPWRRRPALEPGALDEFFTP